MLILIAAALVAAVALLRGGSLSHFVDLPLRWVPTDNEQAVMRLHRIGQRNACTFRVATLAGTIDDQIGRTVVRKLNDIRALFG